MVSITFFELEKWEEELVKKKIRGHKLKFFPKYLTKKYLPKLKSTEILVVFINSKINKEILEKLPKLKAIATASTGFDHIDIEECKKRKIKVSNVPSYGTRTVAEHTFALLFSISKNLYKSFQKTKKCDFKFKTTELRGFDLAGKTLGVIGTGKIGKHVIKIAKGLEMNVLGYDIYPDKKYAKKMNYKYTKTLKELLQKSDIITLHTVLNNSTYHLLNKKNIKFIKKGAVLINTARGALIDTFALIEALDKGIISACGLDVLEEEKLLHEDYRLKMSKEQERMKSCNKNLMKRENVFVTPHNAFNSQEAVQRIINTTIQNVQSFLKNKQINKVC